MSLPPETINIYGIITFRKFLFHHCCGGHVLGIKYHAELAVDNELYRIACINMLVLPFSDIAVEIVEDSPFAHQIISL